MKKRIYLLLITLILLALFLRYFTFDFNSIILNLYFVPYAFTFFIFSIYLKNKEFKEAKRLLNYSIITFLIFYLLFNSLQFIMNASVINNIFTNSYNISSNIKFNYLDFSPILFGIIYYITHSMFIALFEAIQSIGKNTHAIVLSLYIVILFDTIVTVPIIYFKDIFFLNDTFFLLVKSLTHSFILNIFLILIILFLYFVTPKKA